MLITIMRHGEASMRAATDAERPLTERGSADVAKGARELLGHCRQAGLEPPERLLHSPYLRTTQTAGVVAEALALTPHMFEQLAPGHGPADIERADILIRAGAAAHLLLVSHQPLVSLMVMRWCGVDSPRYALNPGGFTTLMADTMLPGMASHTFSALPPNFEVLS